MAAPAAPSGLVAHPLTGSIINLSWVDNSSNELNFELERSPNGTTGWTLIASPLANATTYANTGLAQNTTYFYRIRAVNADGNSAYSNIASALTLLPGRAPITPRMYLHIPRVVFAAQVNAPTPYEYPIGFVAFDNVTTGAYTDIRPGMTLLLGTTPGADNLGRQRVRAAATATQIFVGRSSFGHHDGELMAHNNMFLTVLDERRVWAKLPYIDSTGESFKDGVLEVEWRTTEPPPVAVMGAGFAGTTNATTGVIVVLFNGQNSYAVADGATIVAWLWDMGDGTIISGVATDDFITATFEAGFRYVSLTVTDSNGHSHTTERPIFAEDADDRQSFDAFQITSHRITEQGQTLTVAILADMPRVIYPDGTLCMIWEFEQEGAAERSHMLIIGWLDTENNSMGAGRNGLTRDTTLIILDVAARLDMLPGLPQSIADDDSRIVEKIPNITWAYMVAPNLLKYIHYLLLWHSTALEVADFIMPDDAAAFPFTLLSSDGDSLWNQVDRRARAFVPDRVLTCDRAGVIRIVPDPMLADYADRTAIIQAAIDENEWSDIRYTYQRSPRTHWLRAGAILAMAWADLPLDVNGNKYIPTVFSIAPGDTPGQGLGEMVQGEQLALSQDALNAASGHRYTRANAPLGMLVVTLLQDDGAPGTDAPWREIEPAWKEWVTLTVSAETAARRRLTFTAARFLPKEVNIRYAQTKYGLARTVELTLELETVGTPGKTVVKPVDIPAVGEQPPAPPPTVPPDYGLVDGQELVAGIGLSGLYRTADFQTMSGSGGPTWEFVDLVVDGNILSWVVDPFSPGYLTGVGAINGWVATATELYRVEEIFGVTTCTPVVTFATTALWRTIQASFGYYQPVEADNPWLICLSYYGNAAGHTGTWATYSVDGGATWSAEVLVSSFYDSGGASNPVGLYLSPKTPGLGYTAAHVATTNPGVAAGYQTLDWGATWTLMSELEEDPDKPWPLWHSWKDDTILLDTHVGARANLSAVVSATGVSASGNFKINLRPPAAAVRVNITVKWSWTHIKSGGLGNPASAINQSEPSFVTDLDTQNTAQPSTPGTTSGSFSETFQVTSLPRAFPGNREAAEASPPTGSSALAIMWTVLMAVSPTGAHTMGVEINLSFTVTEIELADGTIYVPPTASGAILPDDGQAGQIHSPWLAAETLLFYGSLNRSGAPAYALKRALGAAVATIGPSGYGINHGAFAVRADDGGAASMVLGGVSATQSGVWVSGDGGDNWTQIVAPAAVTAYQAAFGDDDQMIFIWGPAGYMGYSTDQGAAIDSRAGNLAALGATVILGIAGGPLP